MSCSVLDHVDELIGAPCARLTELVHCRSKPLKEVPTKTAILERFLHPTEITTIIDESYRKPSSTPSEDNSNSAQAPTGTTSRKQSGNQRVHLS